MRGAISLAQGEDLKWISTDIIELVAFALHVQIPIFLNVTDEPQDGELQPERTDTDLPSVFENVLTEILYSETEPLSNFNQPGRNRQSAKVPAGLWHEPDSGVTEPDPHQFLKLPTSSLSEE